MPLLEGRALTQSPWLDAYDLALEPGEVVVLSGPSGAGKTRLLRLLADLDPRDGGQLLLDGVSCEAQRAQDWRRQVLYLHQTPVRFEGSVLDNLLEITRCAAHACVDVSTQVDGFDPRQPMEQLSGGEAQRLALARGMALGPRVLLLDEATSALDEERAHELEQRITSWARAPGESRAVLWISHDTRLAARIDARVLLFGDGAQ